MNGSVNVPGLTLPDARRLLTAKELIYDPAISKLDAKTIQEALDLLVTLKAAADHTHPAQTSVSGNAGTATKLATARTIDGIDFDGSTAIVHYGTCATAAATAAKVVACTGLSLVTGARIAVKFSYANTAASPTLNVNGTGAKAIVKYGTTAVGANMWAAGSVVEFAYDGTSWVMLSAGANGIQPVSNGGTGKSSWTANRLIYPSAGTTLAQLAFPATAGSVLRQGTSGAPYWTSPEDLLAAIGGAKIQTGSYVGTGTYGSANPCSLTFGFIPKLVVIQGGRYPGIIIPASILTASFLTSYGWDTFDGATTSTSRSANLVDKTVSWYCGSTKDGEYCQANGNGETYTYIAIG